MRGPDEPIQLAVVGVGMYDRRRGGAGTSSPDVVDTDGATTGSAGAPQPMTGIRVGVGVVAVVLASLGTYQIAKIGHSGAKATWDDVQIEGSDNDGD